MEEFVFEAVSKLNIKIRTTYFHWRLITEQKHPEVKGKENEVIKTLENPDEIRLSKKDKHVYLYYRKSGKYYYSIVTRHFEEHGFIITAYLTRNIMEGEKIWKK